MKNGWGKIAFKLNSDSLIQTTSTVVGSSPTAYQDSQGDEDGDIIAAIEYNGLVYDAYYYQKGVTEDSDIDFTTDFVNCDQYNTVAANFLEEQIKINYKK